MKKIDYMNRIYHHWEKWECYKAGFFRTTPPEGMDKNMAEIAYSEFLSDTKRFAKAIERVFVEWPHSCEQFLTNPSMNRVAWLGQAAMCIETGVSSKFRAGFKLLSEDEQQAANACAKRYLDQWLESHEKD